MSCNHNKQSSTDQPFFTILAKPTLKCNLKCKFCYQSHVRSGQNMSRETKEALIKRACEHENKNISIQWIGGETLAVGIDFFLECEELLLKHQKEGQFITSSLQTNGTLLNMEWVDFIKKYKRYSLSISFEIFPCLQNNLRVGEGKYRDSYTIVKDNLSMLNENGVEYGVLTVIEKETLDIPPKDWIEQVVKLGIRQIGMQFSYQNVYSGDLLMTERYINWVEELFIAHAAYSKACKDESRQLIIRESFYLYNIIMSPAKSIGCCHHNKNICNDFLVTVDTDGGVYGHCDSFMDYSTRSFEKYRVGSVYDNSFQEIMAGESIAEIRKELLVGRLKCKTCSYYDICRGGCGFFKAMSGGYIDSGYGDSIDSYCGIKIALLDHVIDIDKRKTIIDTYYPIIGNSEIKTHLF